MEASPHGEQGSELPYVLENRLGGSGGTEVWTAHAIDGGERIALKLIRDADRSPLASFRHELQAAQSLEHPTIVRIIDFGESKNGLYIATELVEPSVSLAALIARQTARRTPLSSAMVAYIGISLAEALDHAASRAKLDGLAIRLVHRHLSPTNVLIDAEGRVRLVDLAIPASRTAVSPISGQLVRGTPGYLAPEQVKGETVDERADVFVLGAVIHECATLQTLFGRPDPNAAMKATLEHVAEPLADLVSGFPAALSRVVHKALARDVTERYADAGELRVALRESVPTIPGYNDARVQLATLVGAAIRAQKSESEARTKLIDDDFAPVSTGDATGEVESTLDEPTGAMLAPPIPPPMGAPPMGAPPMSAEPAKPVITSLSVLAGEDSQDRPADQAPVRTVSSGIPVPRVKSSVSTPRTPTRVPRAPTRPPGALTALSSMLEDPVRRTPILLGFATVVVMLIVVLITTRPTDQADIELRALYAKADYGAVEAYYREHVKDFRYSSPAFELAADAWRRQRIDPLPATAANGATAAPPASAPPRIDPSAPNARELASIEVPEDIPDPPVKRNDRKARTKAKKGLQAGLRALEMGDVVSAEKSFRRCIVALDSAACRLHLALLHARAGETDEAVSNYERYLELWPEAPGADRLRALTAALAPIE